MSLIANCDYQGALDSLNANASDPTPTNTKAVLLLRLGRAEAATNLLRSTVWDSKTFSMKPNVPAHVKLNFATGLLMAGQVAGCMQVVRSMDDPDNEQAAELMNEIQAWEKSISVWRWLDWKICGIEHTDAIPMVNHLPGRFGWEPRAETVLDGAITNELPRSPSQKLAC